MSQDGVTTTSSSPPPAHDSQREEAPSQIPLVSSTEDHTSSSPPSPAAPPPWANRNVRYTLLYNFLDGSCYSLWGAQLIPVLLGRLAGDAGVGEAAAAAGVAQIAGALVAGYVGDEVPRQAVIRVGACFGLCAIAVYVVGLWWLRFAVFVGAQALWGVYTGVTSTSVEALFADSVSSGHRTQVYTFKWVVQTMCYVVGYAAALGMLLSLGNEWTTPSVQVVMAVGLCAHPCAHVVLFFLQDRFAVQGGGLVVSPAPTTGGGGDSGGGLRAPSSHHHHRRAREVVVVVTTEADTGPHPTAVEGAGTVPSEYHGRMAESGQHEKRSSAGPAFQSCDSAPTTNRTSAHAAHAVSPRSAAPHGRDHASDEVEGEEEEDEEGEDHDEQSVVRRGLLRQDAQRHLTHTQLQEQRGPPARLCAALWYTLRYRLCSWSAVPYLICFVDLLMAVGSGMTLQYFPLYFVNVHHLSPVWLYVAYIAVTCLTAVMSNVVRWLAERALGRVPAVIVVRLIGTTCLLCMGVGTGWMLTRPWVLTFFLVRNACMNSVLGMTRSVIMDAVKKENRAKWSAFESFSSFTWAGSALLGGLIAEAKGYRYCFTVTAVVHYVGVVLLLPAAIGARLVDEKIRELRRE